MAAEESDKRANGRDAASDVGRALGITHGYGLVQQQTEPCALSHSLPPVHTTLIPLMSPLCFFFLWWMQLKGRPVS